MRRVIVFAALVVVTVITAATTAGAEKQKVNFSGPGTYNVLGDGSAAIAGTATGDPLDGQYGATLMPTDGTLPEPGACEPATAVLRLVGSRDRVLGLTSSGTVCGQHLQPPLVVTQVYTGRYEITEGPRRPLVGTDGFVELRLAVDGRAHAFAVDT